MIQSISFEALLERKTVEVWFVRSWVKCRVKRIGTQKIQGEELVDAGDMARLEGKPPIRGYGKMRIDIFCQEDLNNYLIK